MLTEDSLDQLGATDGASSPPLSPTSSITIRRIRPLAPPPMVCSPSVERRARESDSAPRLATPIMNSYGEILDSDPAAYEMFEGLVNHSWWMNESAFG